MTARRIAIVAIHGVAPHPRYEFQDQVSELLSDRLNQRGGEQWVIDVVNPELKERDTDDPLPTISRLRQRDDSPADPERDTIDVIEAYWSPIDKGKAKWYGVLHWIMRAVFTPLNTTARVTASWQKQVFDYTYIGGSVVLAFVLFAVSLSALWEAMSRMIALTGLLSQTNPAQTLTALNQNVSTTAGVPIKIVVWLAIGAIGAYLVTQALTGIANTVVQVKYLLADPASIWHRAFSILLLAAIGAAMIVQMALVQFPHGILGWSGVAFLVLIFIAFNLGRALLSNFLTDFFGDVQIYCTHDENSELFELRSRIVDTAVHAARRALCPGMNGGQSYDAVILLAHSLGATIGMDALIQLYQLSEQGAISAEEFGRLRAFVTLGSSLEKTRYFFDVSTSSRSMTFGCWRDNLYGALFVDDPSALAKSFRDCAGIFWINYWYFQDPIANAIASFRSYSGRQQNGRPAMRLHDARAAGDDEGTTICRNERGFQHMSLLRPLLHGEYLYDDWFWNGAPGHIGMLDIIDGVRSGARRSPPIQDATNASASISTSKSEEMSAATSTIDDAGQMAPNAS